MAKIYFFVLLSTSLCTAVVANCHKYCSCDVIYDRNRANCSANNLQNAYVQLPETVQILDMSYNNISVIDNSCFENYSYLSHLSLSHNSLHAIHREAFSMLRRVRFIDLSFNQLIDLDEHLIETNSQLYALTLEGNKFMLTNQRRLLRSKFLRSLNLRNSQLYCIEELMFAGLPELQELDLSENLIIKINIAAFIALPNLKLVDITASQWMQNDLNFIEDIDRFQQQHSHITLRFWDIDYPKSSWLGNENEVQEMVKATSISGNKVSQQWHDLKSLAENEENKRNSIKNYNYEDTRSSKESLDKYIHYSNVSPRCRSACGLSFFSLREACDQKLSNLSEYLAHKFPNVHIVKEKNDSSTLHIKLGLFVLGFIFTSLITCGVLWLESYIQSIFSRMYNKIKQTSVSQVFVLKNRGFRNYRIPIFLK